MTPRIASCITARSSALSIGCFAKWFINSITAAIAVLKVLRRPMSSLTLVIVLCNSRRVAFCAEFNDKPSKLGASPACVKSCASFQTRFKNRCAPSTPESDHSSVCSGGDVNMMNKRTVSAPYCSITD